MKYRKQFKILRTLFDEFYELFEKLYKNISIFSTEYREIDCMKLTILEFNDNFEDLKLTCSLILKKIIEIYYKN